MKLYKHDQKTSLWARPGFAGIDYSDGVQTEERIMKIMTAVTDPSVMSEELQNHISDWPTEYHFSRLRHCLIKPLGIKAGDRVLELGCGCGAITRYLGEIGAEVVSVEGGRQRACIAAKRCHDLTNVRIVWENLVDFSSDEKFDWVLLIGVLEYAPLFAVSGGTDPVLTYLSSAASFLSAWGKLVVAIENQLGLKYFNGCGEDHNGVPFFGINDAYGEKSFVTYGRRELQQKLTEAGMNSQEFFYPYPDYKLPTTVLHSSAFQENEVCVSDLLMRCRSRDYLGNRHRFFSEQFAVDVLERNRLLEDFANSFLVVAAREESIESVVDNEFGWIFSCTGRRAPFSTETQLKRNENGKLAVIKSRLNGEPGISEPFGTYPEISQVCSSDLFYNGELLIRGILRAWLVEPDHQKIGALFGAWFNDLRRHAFLKDSGDPVKLEDWLIPGKYADALPFNCMVKDDGGLVYFDLEWRVSGEVSLGWLLVRGIVWSLSIPVVGIIRQNGVHPRAMITLEDIVLDVCAGCGLTVSGENIGEWLDYELAFLTTVSGETDIKVQREFHPPANVLTYVTMLEERIRALELEGRELTIGVLFFRKLKRLVRHLLPGRPSV